MLHSTTVNPIVWIRSKSSDVELPESNPANAKAILEKPRLDLFFFPFFDAILEGHQLKPNLISYISILAEAIYLSIPFGNFTVFFFWNEEKKIIDRVHMERI